jgi:hypothetical protein
MSPHAAVAIALLLAGCTPSKEQQCKRIFAIVEDEMHATDAFGKASAATGTIPFETYAAALRKASGGVSAVGVQDPALRKAVDTYVDATAKLAGAYEAAAAAPNPGDPALGNSATTGIIYGTILDQSRIAIANACPR